MVELEPGWLKRQADSLSLDECPTCRNRHEAARTPTTDHKAVREALQKYGDHTAECKRVFAGHFPRKACVCGFAEALAALNTPSAEQAATQQPDGLLEAIARGISKARKAFADAPLDFLNELADEDLVAFIHDEIGAPKREPCPAPELPPKGKTSWRCSNPMDCDLPNCLEPANSKCGWRYPRDASIPQPDKAEVVEKVSQWLEWKYGHGKHQGVAQWQQDAHDLLGLAAPSALPTQRDHSRLVEWQPIETAPMGRHDDPSTYFIGARQDGMRINTGTCYRNEHGAYEWWGGGLRPTHWKSLQSLPAAPAKAGAA